VVAASYRLSVLRKTSRPWWKLLRTGNKMVSGIPKLTLAINFPPVLEQFVKLIVFHRISKDYIDRF
jgi:hypothetical protein